MQFALPATGSVTLPLGDAVSAARRHQPMRTTYRAISTDSAGGAISVWATVQ